MQLMKKPIEAALSPLSCKMPTSDPTARAARTARRGATSSAMGSYCDRKEFAEALRRRTKDAMTDEEEEDEDGDESIVAVVVETEDDET